MEEVYYEDDFRPVEPAEIQAITLGSIVEGFDGEGPSFELSRTDQTLSKANFYKILEMIEEECSHVWKICNADWAFEDQQITKEERDAFNDPNYEMNFLYCNKDYQDATKANLIADPTEVNKEILKIFFYCDDYHPAWDEEAPHNLQLWRLGKDIYKNTDCGAWLNFKINEELC